VPECWRKAGERLVSIYEEGQITLSVAVAQDVLVAYMLDGRCRTLVRNFDHTLAGLSVQSKVTQLVVRVKRQSC